MDVHPLPKVQYGSLEALRRSLIVYIFFEVVLCCQVSLISAWPNDCGRVGRRPLDGLKDLFSASFVYLVPGPMAEAGSGVRSQHM
eukprot:9015361-Karenia_brevis.AAC.1